MRWIAVSLAGVVLATVVTVSARQQPPAAAKDQNYRAGEKGAWSVGAAGTADPLVATRGKVCSVFAPSNWRDSLNVGDGWTAASCREFMIRVGAQHYQLGCMRPASMDFGLPDGGGPSPNCGW